MRSAVAGLLLIAALLVLHRELASSGLADLRGALSVISPQAILIAGMLTLLNYAVLTCFDQLAFSTLGIRAARWRVAVVAFISYAVSNTVGWSILSGSSVRYRYYSRWGLTNEEIARVVVLCSGTFWLGVLVLGGVALVADPAPAVSVLVPQPWVVVFGACLFGMAAAYASLPALRTSPLRLGDWAFPVPNTSTIGVQFLLSVIDWTLAGAVLWILLPEPRPVFVETLGAFIAAQLLGLASHVPGGVGVFESVMVLLMKPDVAPETMIPALIAYRLIYYVLPFSVAVSIVAIDEARFSGVAVRRATAALGRAGATIAPRLLAAGTFVAGAVLLFSGATPAIPTRLAWLARIIPYPVLEVSHFVGSIVGIVLLLLSQAVARRVDAAWTFSVVSLSIGIGASLLKGGDYEEALILAALLAALVAARSKFDRKSEVFDAPFSRRWFTVVLAVVAASYFLGTFAFRHIDYSNELWWRFALDGDAPRFLRASVGVGVTVLAFAVRHLLMPAAPELSKPDDRDLEAAAGVIARQPFAHPNLVFLRDKALLFNDDRSAFMMFAVQGRTWVALHDPVGPLGAVPELIRLFIQRVDACGGIPVFYQVRPENLHYYADVGLTIAKIGEEASVPLADFTLAGGTRKSPRTAINRLTREGFVFRLLTPAEVRSRLTELRSVSDDWLEQKAGGEKGFSLGFFDPDYLTRFPVAVLERDGEIEAFANIWESSGRREVSVDLARYRKRAPGGIGEGLFAHLMLWGRDHGYTRFGLGMAPLSGIDATGIGPRWRPLVRYVYRHGETFYNFQGVRSFKAKFDPVWEPRYLAYPGGLSAARVLADVSALIAGGYRRIFFKAP